VPFKELLFDKVVQYTVYLTYVRFAIPRNLIRRTKLSDIHDRDKTSIKVATDCVRGTDIRFNKSPN
jgi:hypothetical protein